MLITNIKNLLQIAEKPIKWRAGEEMKHLPKIENAFLWIENGKVKDFGSMENVPKKADKIIDATGKFILPTFVDSHTHLVFATSREGEYIDRIKGLTYEEIAENGGGILNSAKKLQAASEDKLFESAWERLEEIMQMGTGAVEIKSGYGLTHQDEIKMLRVIKRMKEKSPITIKSNFLGAHAIPTKYKNNRATYINLIIEKMLPQIADEGLADYIDVFCDRGFFTVEETNQILEAGTKYGLQAKIHANELDFSGGIQVGVKNKALSVDHLEFTGESEIQALLNSETMPTILPSTAFFLGLIYAPARKMIEAGLPIALASDYNPGSSPSGNMSFILALACTKMKLLPEEALNACTINSAYAMGLSQSHGTIRKGMDANFILTKKMPSLAYLPYSFGSNLIDSVFIKGEKM